MGSRRDSFCACRNIFRLKVRLIHRPTFLSNSVIEIALRQRSFALKQGKFLLANFFLTFRFIICNTVFAAKNFLEYVCVDSGTQSTDKRRYIMQEMNLFEIDEVSGGLLMIPVWAFYASGGTAAVTAGWALGRAFFCDK
jgi:hypothetical protein